MMHWINPTEILKAVLDFRPPMIFQLFCAHLASTIPATGNKWIDWISGGLQVLFGQRGRGQNTIDGKNTFPLATEPGTTKKEVKTILEQTGLGQP